MGLGLDIEHIKKEQTYKALTEHCRKSGLTLKLYHGVDYGRNTVAHFKETGDEIKVYSENVISLYDNIVMYVQDYKLMHSKHVLKKRYGIPKKTLRGMR